ncbi:YcnI family protein [uncultured Williamsia sp.]|uniref:YcnI family copper-binding membrane protein n=1 Tax=uncultured Williamsia sp. TaxID=259311 RepID=UPI002619FEBC|nr:YcnI family protein [uncultured Williamsia sp.]
MNTSLRTIGAIAATAATVGLAGLVAPGVASAHVTANGPGLVQGGYGVITFNVPNETADNATTTKVSVTVPNLKSARPEAVPGWQATVAKNANDEITAVTWQVQPGSAGIAPGGFQRFALSAGPLPEKNTVSMPAVQTYSDGEVVDWNQPMNADGSEPEHPAPELTLAAEESSTAAAPDASDTTARWLGGVGLAVGVIGAGVAVLALRRKSS